MLEHGLAFAVVSECVLVVARTDFMFPVLLAEEFVALEHGRGIFVDPGQVVSSVVGCEIMICLVRKVVDCSHLRGKVDFRERCVGVLFLSGFLERADWGDSAHIPDYRGSC